MKDHVSWNKIIEAGIVEGYFDYVAEMGCGVGAVACSLLGASPDFGLTLQALVPILARGYGVEKR